MDAKAFTAVSLVISLRKRSRSTYVVHKLCKPLLLQELDVVDPSNLKFKYCGCMVLNQCWSQEHKLAQNTMHKI